MTGATSGSRSRRRTSSVLNGGLWRRGSSPLQWRSLVPCLVAVVAVHTPRQIQTHSHTHTHSVRRFEGGVGCQFLFMMSRERARKRAGGGGGLRLTADTFLLCWRIFVHSFLPHLLPTSSSLLDGLSPPIPPRHSMRRASVYMCGPPFLLLLLL